MSDNTKPALLHLCMQPPLFVPSASMRESFEVISLSLDELSLVSAEAVGIIIETSSLTEALLNVIKSRKSLMNGFAVCLITPEPDEHLYQSLSLLVQTIRFSPEQLTTEHDRICNDLEKLFVSIWGTKRYNHALKIRSHRSGLVDSLGIVAHQWRQPINLISMEAINLMIQTGIDEEIKSTCVTKSAQIISDQAQRMSEILKSVLNLGKIHRAKELFSIRGLFEHIASLWNEQLKHSGIELLIPPTGEESQIYGYQTDLEEVLINLIANAKDAYLGSKNEGGRFISLEARSDQSHIYLSVRDEAGGVPEPLREEIFQPNFSTKNKEEGFGIGLHVARLIVEQEFKGSLELKVSTKGSSFIVTIPRNDLSNLRFVD
jgi:signal transduction histidine kinase